MGLEGIEAFMGKRVHETLEFLYHEINAGRVPTIKEVLAVYVRDWDKFWHDNIKIVKERFTAEDYKKLGEKCLLNYYHEHEPFDQPVLAIEKRVLVDIDGIKLQGFIDRLDVKDGHYEIIDYKTGGSLPSQEKIDQDRQLALYQLGLQQMFNDIKEVRLIWHYLSFGKKLESKRSPEQLERLKLKIKDLVKQIETEKEYLPTKSMLCNWCDYKTICTAWENDRQTALEGINETELVEEYVNLNKEAKKLKTKLLQTKEKIKSYSNSKSVDTIKSENHELKLVQIKGITEPQKKEVYDELITKLKELSLYEKVMNLDLNKLQEVINENENFAKELKPFLNESSKKKLMLKKF